MSHLFVRPLTLFKKHFKIMTSLKLSNISSSKSKARLTNIITLVTHSESSQSTTNYPCNTQIQSYLWFSMCFFSPLAWTPKGISVLTEISVWLCIFHFPPHSTGQKPGLAEKKRHSRRAACSFFWVLHTHFVLKRCFST